VLVLFTHNYGEGALAGARQAVSAVFPGVKVAGGTVNGFVHDGRRIDAFMANDRGVAVLALGSAEEPVIIALGADPSDGPREAGAVLARRAAESLGGALGGGLVFSTGLSTGVHVHDGALVDGIASAAGEIGLAGCGLCGGVDIYGNALPGRAFAGDEEHTLGVLLVAFGAAAAPRYAIANGVSEVARIGKVTAADGPAIKTIDGRPARAVLLDALVPDGDDARKAQLEGSLLVACVESRTCLAVADRKLGLLWPHVPVQVDGDGFVDLFRARTGDDLLLARTDVDACLAAVSDAAEQLVEQGAAAPEYDLLVSFSCVMRGLILGDRAGTENESMARRVPSRQHLGIVANGEIGSYRNGSPASTGWSYSIAALGSHGSGR
jgi:hypothetical protein